MKDLPRYLVYSKSFRRVFCTTDSQSEAVSIAQEHRLDIYHLPTLIEKAIDIDAMPEDEGIL